MVVAPRWTGREAAALRQARRMSIRAYAAHLGVATATVTNWESRGERARLRTETQQLLDIDLARAPYDVQQRFAAILAGGSRGLEGRHASVSSVGLYRSSAAAVASPSADMDGGRTPTAIDVHAGGDQPPDLREVELVRQGLIDTLREGSMAEANLDDWDLTVLRHGRATRDRPAGVLLEDLSTDLAELKRALHRHRSASSLRRLTRAAAQMSGLMCLTLCKLDQRSAFRLWARTARLAADEAGDPQTQSWTLAQEAYGHFYSTDLAEAIDVARQAQAVAARTPCVGAALAAALEARAYAAMGLDQETRSALGRAETNLSNLEGDALMASAFGYNEAQLRFHEGNAYTHLGDVRSALAAQDRALKLCSPGDYTDWAMTRLDRAACLTRSGDTADALNYAADTLVALSDAQRLGIINLRGREILNSLPKDRQTLSAAGDLRDLLMLTTERKEVTGP